MLLGSLGLGICTNLIAQPPIYKTVDENGNITYSDNPPDKDSKPYQLPSINSQPAHSTEGFPKAREKTTTQATENYYISIASPADDQAIPPGQLSVSIVGSIEPAPKEALTFELVVDGSVALTGSSPTFVLSPLLRGTHIASIRAIDKDGNLVTASNNITFHVIRPNVSN
ncbi:DUF4124 domain-containing protein [Marinibactrum halimedae]|nr:DUF4124 domain-containing protein [Marinibactrum halimedae]